LPNATLSSTLGIECRTSTIEFQNDYSSYARTRTSNQILLKRGVYHSLDEVVEAALTAVEQRTVPGFSGTQRELEALLAEGRASELLTDDEFWDSINKRTEALLGEKKSGRLS
jgi:Arc/MetJ-type ribon-helix-helix transcriptional regulator